MSHSIFCKSNEVSVTPALPTTSANKFLSGRGVSLPALGESPRAGAAEGHRLPGLPLSLRSFWEEGEGVAAPPPPGTPRMQARFTQRRTLKRQEKDEK